MPIDRSLRIAFLISAVLHALLFLQGWQFKTLSIKKPPGPLVVTYLIPKEVPAAKPRVKEKPAPRLQTAKAVRPKKEIAQKTPKKPLEQTRDEEKIEIPPELPKEKEALYIGYYQSIRGRIREFVVENYPRFIACGEVCLRFVLLSNGKLKELSVIEERSTPNHLLQEIAKKSLRRASPFAPFPKGLGQAQLSFNVIISFELEE